MDKKVMSKSSKNLVSKPKEQKITHLYLNDKYLKRIPKLVNAQYLSVIYLHNNEIYEITNLNNAVNLTSLYLQKNRILKIENLDNLRKLRKLYLGHNTISVVEGLENLENLEELQLQKQFLFEGNALCFDPRSIHKIANNLKILNISYNKIQTISSLAPLKFLAELNASHNELADINEVCSVIKDWYYLRNLSLDHNPLAKNRLYKEQIIANAYCLEMLDQKEVSDSTRNFFKNLHTERVSRKLTRKVNLADKITDLPKNYPVTIQKAVSVSILRQNNLDGENLEIFDEKNAVFIPWKTLPKPQNVSKLDLIKRNQKIKSTMRNKTNTVNALSNLKI